MRLRLVLAAASVVWQVQSIRTDLADEELDLGTALLAALPDGPSKELFKSFRPCAVCKEFRRFGELNDGGYLMCMDHLRGISAAYSVGVEHHDEWSLQVQEVLQVPVYQLDCTVDRAAQNCAGCTFLKRCLVGADQEFSMPAWTLSQVLQNTEHAEAPARSLLAKIDIEGSEWPALASAEVSALSKFTQLVVEFHSLDRVDQHATYLKAMQRLQLAGFRVVHLHGNNWAQMFDLSGFSLPDVVEVTFDSQAPASACAEVQDFLPLDRPNNPQALELPAAHLPSL